MDIEKYYDKIYRYCYYRVNDKSKAEDLTQETFLRFLNADCREPERYLYTIARNLCVDEYRKIKPDHMNAEESETAPGGFYSGFERELIEIMTLRAALALMPYEERELLVLRYMNDETISEISKLKGVSRFAVYRQLKKARNRLKELLERGNYER